MVNQGAQNEVTTLKYLLYISMYCVYVHITRLFVSEAKTATSKRECFECAVHPFCWHSVQPKKNRYRSNKMRFY